MEYITGGSALNIPYRGEQADWHSIATAITNNLHVANRNYPSAPVFDETDEIFNCISFLIQHNIIDTPRWCATPVRAIVDMVYHALCKMRIPNHIILDDYMVNFDRSALRPTFKRLETYLNENQVNLLHEWMRLNQLITSG